MSVISAPSCCFSSLNESPSEKEGKCAYLFAPVARLVPSMKVPPKRKGNAPSAPPSFPPKSPSMKVPPKRKGNLEHPGLLATPRLALNESPSEKEGKFRVRGVLASVFLPPQ